jgi:uncharacterized cupin superfamily protein
VSPFNWHTAALEVFDDVPEGYGAPASGIAAAIGGKHLAGTLAELAPGQKLAPYHWEAAQEEWVIVLSGTPSVRTPEGTHELRPGDVACFARGPAGAHQVLNASDAPARVIMLSESTEPNVISYPDSGKIGVRAPDIRHNFRADDGVGYWDREP